jgi:putative transposase
MCHAASANGAAHTSLGHRPRDRKRWYQTRPWRYRSDGMPQSLACVLIHLVFSTKQRAPFLTKSLRPGVHAYLATVARNAGCECFRVGGTEDHVHLAIRLRRTISVAHLVEELKTSSSKWVKTQSPELAGFSWQRGYGVFSIAYEGLEELLSYIDNQVERHRLSSFQVEYLSMLGANGVEYDERYVWE